MRPVRRKRLDRTSRVAREAAHRRAVAARKAGAAPLQAAAVEPSRMQIPSGDSDTLANAVRVAVATTCTRYGLLHTDDIEQQAWLEALIAYPKYDPSRNVLLGAYVCGVVRLRLVDWLRKDSPLTRPQLAENQRARREGRELPWHPVITSYDATDYDGGTSAADRLLALADDDAAGTLDDVVDRVDAQRMIVEARKLFRPGTRAAFLFEHVLLDGMTQAEAARQIGVTVSRVSQVMLREVLPRLRERFGEEIEVAA